MQADLYATCTRCNWRTNCVTTMNTRVLTVHTKFE